MASALKYSVLPEILTLFGIDLVSRASGDMASEQCPLPSKQRAAGRPEESRHQHWVECTVPVPTFSSANCPPQIFSCGSMPQ